MSAKSTEATKDKKEKLDVEDNLKSDENSVKSVENSVKSDENNKTSAKSERSQDGSKDPNSKQEEQQITSEWMAVWDANAQAYYWWNTITNETTWENPGGDTYDYSQYNTTTTASTASTNPLDTLLDKIDSQVKTTLGDGTQADNNTSYEQYYTQDDNAYASQAHFNARTGRFTTNQDVERLNPENFTIENRATKQMNYYFDVDTYTEEYNRQKQMNSGKKRALTRKEVEYFKKMKKEKKSKRAREWLLQ